MAAALRFLPRLDSRSLALFRILLGVVLITDLLVFRLPNLTAFYSPTGILAGSTGNYFVERLTLLHFIPGEAWIRLFFALSLLFYTLFLLGYRANLFAALSLLSLWSIHQQATLIISSDDRAVLCLLFWSIFLPIGEKFALRPSPPMPGGSEVRALATLGILSQIALIYFFNAYQKDGLMWQNGTALAYALMDDLWVKPAALWLLSYPGLCAFLTYTVRPIEFAIPLLIFCPVYNQLTRGLAAAMIVSFHWSIFVFISLGFYPLIATTWASLLVPAWVWDRAAKRFGCLGKEGKPLSPDTRVGGHRLLRAVIAVFLTTVLGVVFAKNALTFYHSWNGVPKTAEETSGAPPATDSNRDDMLGRLTAAARRALRELEHTSLFRQHWSLYAPNPPVDIRWIKVRGLTAKGRWIDMWTGKPVAESAGVSAYQTEPWQNLAWIIVYGPSYGFRHASRLAERWARYEFDRWNDAHPGAGIQRAQIIGHQRFLAGPNRAMPPTRTVLAQYAR